MEGFRILTEGVDLAQFIKNPVMLFMHIRPGASKDAVLALGHWEDIEVKDGVISAVPVFDDKDEFAMQIYNKVEAGHYRMSSGGFMPIELSDDPAVLLPGQTLPTVTKCWLREASIVDFGVNNNAITATLYDSNNNIITLSQSDVLNNFFKNKKEKPMKEVINLVLVAAALGLKADSNTTEQSVIDKINDLNAKANEALNLAQKNADLQKQIDDLKAQQKTEKINAVVELAVKEGRILEGQKAHYTTLAQADLDTTTALLKSLPQHKSAEQLLAEKNTGAEADPLLKLSFDDAHKSGQLQSIKEKHPEYYKSIFKAKFGKEPNS